MKFKSLFLAMTVAAFGSAFIACDDDDTTYDVAELNVPVSELAVPVAGMSWNVDVTASVAPTVTVDASWIAVKEATSLGSNKYTLNFDIEANEEDGNVGTPRTATITIGAFDQAAYIVVNQDGAAVTEDNYTINYGDQGFNSTAQELAKKMGTGVNIGNTFECANLNSDGSVSSASETLWGNPSVVPAYIAGLKAAGFKSVRIPTAWYAHMDKDGKIDAEWMAKVKRAVSYCFDNDLYVVLNDHYDAGWLEPTMGQGYRTSRAAILKNIWTQVAEEFAGFDERLLFAGLNEPNCGSGNFAAHSYAALTRYEQDFIDAVRATGGNNGSRILVVQGPNTDIDLSTNGSYTMPVDAVADRLMFEVHFYGPYQYSLMTEDANWSPVWWYYGTENHVAGSTHNSQSGYGDDQWIAGQFKKMYDSYGSKGIPVILGEYGANTKNMADDIAKMQAGRAYWHEVVNREAVKNGCIPFLWEVGECGKNDNFNMADIDRNSGSVRSPYLIEGIMKGYNAATLPF